MSVKQGLAMRVMPIGITLFMFVIIKITLIGKQMRLNLGNAEFRISEVIPKNLLSRMFDNSSDNEQKTFKKLQDNI